MSISYARSALGKLFLGAPTFLGAPRNVKIIIICRSPPGTQAIEMTEAKEITYSHVRLSYHSGIKH